MIRIGMIGLGGMGNHHANYLSKKPNVKIVGVCDIIEEKAKATAQRIGTDWCLDYRDLLGKCDAVWVCTEPFNRVKIITTCAAAGKHIFSEKPICLTLKDADTMIAAARKARVKYMLGYVLRFTDPYKLIHDTFVSGELGDLVSCWTRRFMPCDMSKLWYGHQKKSGGVILDFGSHDIDWLLWVGGKVRRAFGKSFTVRPTMHADEHGQSMLVFEKGGMGSSEISWSSYLYESSVGLIGTKGSMIVGQDGQVRKQLLGDKQQTIVTAESAMAVNLGGEVGQKDAAGSIRKVVSRDETIQEHFFRCIEEDFEPLTAATEGRKVLATVEAIRKSARTGRSVKP